MDKRRYGGLEAYMISCMRDSSHDREHVYRVLFTALDIARKEKGVKTDVLIAACLLHDIGRDAQNRDPAVCHAREGSRMAYDFLLKSGWLKEDAAHVARCILTHRYRKSQPPESIEAKILFDADKIDAAGTMGIARTLIYQGQMGEPIYSVDGEGRILDGSGEEQPSFFREYRFKLQKVYGRLYTARGQAIAQERRKAAKAFYRSIFEEARRCRDKGQKRLEKLLERSGD